MLHALGTWDLFVRFVWFPFVGLFSIALIVLRRRWAKRAKWMFDHGLYLRAPMFGRTGRGWITTTETMRRSLLWVGIFGLSASLGLGSTWLFPHQQVVLTLITLGLTFPSGCIAVAVATRRVNDEDDVPLFPRDDGPERI